MAAIRAKCFDCSGGQPSEIRLCPVERCALYPFRMGTNPHRKRRELSAEQKASLVLRLAGHGEVSPEIEGETDPDDGEGGRES
jgi:hypothetical protein